MHNIYLKDRVFYGLGLVIFLFLLSYKVATFYTIAIAVLILLGILLIIDWFLLSRNRSAVAASRSTGEKLSLGDKQSILYRIENNSSLGLHIELIDELPKQLQYRDGIFNQFIGSGEFVEDRFSIEPHTRGLYDFGNINLYLSTRYLSLIELRTVIPAKHSVKVVPSILQMKKYELMVFSHTKGRSGLRRIRKIGENDEFERIRRYQQGDNIKSINWKATSRMNKIMINQYQNTKSQNVYCIVDKGRSMKMPFEGLTLLDYAINSALVISNIVLRKYDRIGLITYSDKIGALLKSDSKHSQLEAIMDSLYKQKTEFKETSYELLNVVSRKKISRRSLLILFTNFETRQDFLRNLAYLKSINRYHLLLVVFFENTELLEASETRAVTEDQIYFQTFARRLSIEKEQIRSELISNGIQTILTKPQDLSINVINKYLEFKAKRML